MLIEIMSSINGGYFEFKILHSSQNIFGESINKKKEIIQDKFSVIHI